MTVYRKSFPEGTVLLVHRLIEGSKDPNVLKRAQAVYCRAAFDLPLEQIAGLTPARAQHPRGSLIRPNRASS